MRFFKRGLADVAKKERIHFLSQKTATPIPQSQEVQFHFGLHFVSVNVLDNDTVTVRIILNVPEETANIECNFGSPGISFHEHPPNIYTYGQTLSNSKLVLTIKIFRTKILEIHVKLSSFGFNRIEYQCN